LKELNEEFEKLPAERPKPERLLRSEQQRIQAMGGVDAAGDGADGAEAEPEPVDPFDLADAVNVLDRMPKGFYESLASTKWKDRKEALEALYALVNTPKIEDGRYNELVGALAKRVADANILVVVVAVNCIECLAKGLRNGFAQYKNV
ncbi:Microtubule-associated protein, microtubule dynamics during spindle orientation, partial [Quaeritorhiza haematococci]